MFDSVEEGGLVGLQCVTDEVRQCASKLENDESGTIDGFAGAVGKLRSCLADLLGKATNGIPPQHAGRAWEQACLIWNTAVDATTRGLCSSSEAVATQVAWLRHVACELAFELAQPALTAGQKMQLIRFCLKAGKSWAALEAWERSELLLAHAAGIVTAISPDLAQQPQQQDSMSKPQLAEAEQCCSLMYDVQLARYVTACKLNQHDLARQALIKARAAAEEHAPSPAISCIMCYRLARSLHEQAAAVMVDIAQQQDSGDTGHSQCMDALAAAHELIARARDCLQEVTGRQQQQQQQESGQAAAGGDSDVLARKLQQLESKVLLSLAYCNLHHMRDAAACLRCTEALRQLETPEAGHVAVALLAFQAYMAQRQLEQAEKEATGIAVSDASSSEACLAVLLALLDVTHRPEQLKPVLELVLGRFPTDPTILTAFTEHALQAAAAAARQAAAAAAEGPGATSNTIDPSNPGNQQQQQRAYLQQLQDLVLDQVECAEEARAAVVQEPQLQQRLRDALYGHAVGLFGAKEFETAVRFFSAALGVCEERVKGRICRVLAMCHMGMGQLSQASSYCQLADTYEPGSIAASFLRFKLGLLEGNEAALMQELQRMAGCKDFCSDVMWFACREAVSAKCISVAKAALLHLHSILQQQYDSASSGGSSNEAAAPAADSNGLSEGVVLRPVVKLLLEELAQLVKPGTGDTATAPAAFSPAAIHSEVEPDQQPEQHQVQACLSQLSEMLNLVAVRIKRLGFEVFTGEKEAGAVLQVEWFSTVAWNAGIHSAGLRDFQGCAVLMNTSAVLLSLLPNLGAKQLKQQKMAYTLSASAGLEVHLAMPEHTGSLRLASKMLAASAAVSQKLAAVQAGGLAGAGSAGIGRGALIAAGSGAAAARPEGLADAFELLLQFRIALYQRKVKEMLAVVSAMSAHPSVGHELMHKLVGLASQEQYKFPEVASAALEACLSKLMACPRPNPSQVAAVLRAMLQRAASDTAKLKLYREACGILSTLPPNSYPALELCWLVSTCWNTGLHHSRFGRHATSVEYMAAAVDMLPGCAQYQDKRGMMCKQLQQARAAAGVWALVVWSDHRTNDGQ